MAWLSAGAELLISFPTNPVFECSQKPQLATGGYWSGPSGRGSGNRYQHCEFDRRNTIEGWPINGNSWKHAVAPRLGLLCVTRCRERVHLGGASWIRIS